MCDGEDHSFHIYMYCSTVQCYAVQENKYTEHWRMVLVSGPYWTAGFLRYISISISHSAGVVLQSGEGSPGIG